MRVQLRHVFPNPYRDMKNYPINREKVEQLKKSIEQSGFWDNILARKNDSESVQIAYGHHRLTALKEIFPDDYEIDIPVKELDDALMIKIMANENMEEWKAGPAIIDETVKVAKEFLEKNIELAKAYGNVNLKYGEFPKLEDGKNIPPSNFGKVDVGVSIISRFLGWDEFRVKLSLKRLVVINEGHIDRDIIAQLPTEGMADTFLEVVKDMKVTKEEQQKVVDQLKDQFTGKSGKGKSAIQEAVLNNRFNSPKKAKEVIRNQKVLEYSNYVARLRNKLQEIDDELRKFHSLEKEIGVVDDTQRHMLHITLVNIKNYIIKINKFYKDEE